MSDVKHEWRREGATIYQLQNWTTEKGREIVINRWLAHLIPGRGTTPKEVEKVATLMQAAQDMLAALKRGLSALEVAVEAGGGNPETHECCCQMRQAIAKAEGRQS